MALYRAEAELCGWPKAECSLSPPKETETVPRDPDNQPSAQQTLYSAPSTAALLEQQKDKPPGTIRLIEYCSLLLD
jgi:hypothetical protein